MKTRSVRGGPKARQCKVPVPETYSKGRRLALRLSWPDYQMLLELRLALHLDSDSAAVRSLIRLNHSHYKREIAKARKDPIFTERLEDLTNEARQLGLFNKGEKDA